MVGRELLERDDRFGVLAKHLVHAQELGDGDDLLLQGVPLLLALHGVFVVRLWSGQNNYIDLGVVSVHPLLLPPHAGNRFQ